MSLLQRFTGWMRKSGDASMSASERIWLDILGTLATKSGQTVNYATALKVSAVFGCIRVLADGVAQVPLKLYRESDDGRKKEPARDHPLYHLLHRRPNAWQTSHEYRETIIMHTTLCRAHYSFINRIGKRIVELVPFQPQQVTVKIDEDGTRSYKVKSLKTGATQEFPQEAIWHIAGPSWDGHEGLDVLQLAREAVGLAMAMEEHHARIHKQGVMSPGILSVEGQLEPKQYQQLRDWIDKEHASSFNAGKAMILDRAAKFFQMSQTGVDAQHLESRIHQIQEVCRFFRVMPIMLGVSDKVATYASAEQMFLAHVVHTLTPWYNRLEQSIEAWLLTPADAKAGIYAKFVAAGLLRGAMKDTAEYLVKLTTAGIMTRNEAREILDYNALDGLDEPLTPMNMTTAPEPSDKPKDE